MDAEGIEVLHVADGDAGVVAVADDLVLDLLPALQILLHQYLADRAGGEAGFGDAREIGASASDTAAGAAEREGGSDHDGQADGLSKLQCILDGGDGLARRRADAQRFEEPLEELA